MHRQKAEVFLGWVSFVSHLSVLQNVYPEQFNPPTSQRVFTSLYIRVHSFTIQSLIGNSSRMCDCSADVFKSRNRGLSAREQWRTRHKTQLQQKAKWKKYIGEFDHVRKADSAVGIAIVTSSMTFLCLYISRWWRQTWDTAPYFTVVNQSEARISTYVYIHIQVCVLVLILLFVLLCSFFSFGFACYFSVHHFCCYMSRRMNSAGSMVLIHGWRCMVMIVIMIMIAIIRPISCDNVMMIKHLEILHYLGQTRRLNKFLLMNWRMYVCLTVEMDRLHFLLSCWYIPLDIYIYIIYICVCVLISIFAFCYGTEKCHIHIV